MKSIVKFEGRRQGIVHIEFSQLVQYVEGSWDVARSIHFKHLARAFKGKMVRNAVRYSDNGPSCGFNVILNTEGKLCFGCKSLSVRNTALVKKAVEMWQRCGEVATWPN